MWQRIVSFVVMCGVLVARGANESVFPLRQGDQPCYAIVCETNAVDNVRFVAWDLARHLKEITGVEFPIVSPDVAASSRMRRIEVGTQRGAKLAGASEMAKLKHNGALSLLTPSGDVVLVGADAFGVSGAVYDFLEKELQCRWWSPWDAEIPHRPHAALKAFRHLVNPPMDSRWLLITDRLTQLVKDGNLFQFRNGINMLGETETFPNVVLPEGCKALHCEYCVYGGRCHTIFNYLPPKGKNGYFKRHPEYYTYVRDGKGGGRRVPDRHLCFSNARMRRAYAKNFLAKAATHQGKGIFVLELMDTPGAICECDACQAMEKKYGTPGAAFFDFAVELGYALKAQNPDARLHLALYRKEQTQLPPNASFPKFPDNVMVFFAPIGDDFSKPLTHPHNRGTYENFRMWCGLVRHAWSWYYPMPYTTLNPYAGIRRTTLDQRAMQAVGLNGTGYELDVGRDEGANFFDLQFWIYTKLFREPQADVEALVKAFFRGYYGAAADEVWQYWDELERLREAYPEYLHWKESTTAAFAPTRLLRWMRLLDQGAAKLANDSKASTRFAEMRLGLDLMLLSRYQVLRRTQRDFTLSAEVLRDRLTNTYVRASAHRHLRKAQCDKMLASVEKSYRLACAGTFRPAQFKDVPDADFMQSFAIKGGTGCKRRADPDSVIGESLWDDKEGSSGRKDLAMWVFDGIADREILKTHIRQKDMVAGKYAFYKLGTVKLTPSTYIVVGDCWIVLNSLDDLYTPGTDERWDVYVSMKFEGPQYFPDSKLPYSRASFDRSVLIRAR